MDDIIKFGKFKGKTFEQIREEEPSYLLWILDNVNFISGDLYNYITSNIDKIKKEAEVKYIEHIEEECDGEVWVPH